MQTFMCNADDLLALMLADKGIKRNDVHSHYVDEEGALIVDVFEPGDVRPAAS